MQTMVYGPLKTASQVYINTAGIPVFVNIELNIEIIAILCLVLLRHQNVLWTLWHARDTKYQQ